MTRLQWEHGFTFPLRCLFAIGQTRFADGSGPCFCCVELHLVTELSTFQRGDSSTLGAHIRGSFIEDEDAGVLQQGAGHAQQLPLAGAQVSAAFHQLSV